MDNLIVNKLLVMEILLFPSTLSIDNDDFIYPSDDMFESPDYLIVLNEKITKYLEELNPILIPCLDSFSKYVEYISDKIEVGSNKEVTIIRTFGQAVEGPAFLQTDIDLDTALEVHYWNLSITKKLRSALDNAQAAWFKLTVVLAEHIKERENMMKNRKNRENCDLSDDCSTCEDVC